MNVEGIEFSVTTNKVICQTYHAVPSVHGLVRMEIKGMPPAGMQCSFIYMTHGCYAQKCTYWKQKGTETHCEMDKWQT